MNEIDIEALKERLLTDPLDHDARGNYAWLLERDGATEEALSQYRTWSSLAPALAAPVLGQARCLLDLGGRDEALRLYRRARDLEDFAPDEALDALMNVPPKLALVSEPVSNIVALHATTQTVDFGSVVGMEALKKTLRLQIIEPFRNPSLFQRFKKSSGGGVLLYGPPGCGKTLMARALAGECKCSFMSVGISDVLNMYIGQSEANMAAIFEHARAQAPCVLFFDELDALAFARAKARHEHSRSIVNEFLSQLDGFEQNNDKVLILGATNMPWDVDSAMKRAGRFSRQVFVPPPDMSAIAAMLKLKLDGVPHSVTNFDAIAANCQYFSGADVDNLIELGKEMVLADIMDSGNERELTSEDLLASAHDLEPTTVDWLRTANNLVKYAGSDRSYRDVEAYLKRSKFR